MRATIMRCAVLLTLAPGLLACTDDLTTAPMAEELVVVEAFLYAGQPVEDVRLTTAVAIDDTAAVPVIDDALVTLVRDGMSYELEPAGDGVYRYAGADLKVAVGDEFTLEVARGETRATAETVVPEMPVGVELSSDEFVVPELGYGRPGGGLDDELAVSWDNPDDLYHFVVVEGLDPDAEPIFPDEILDRLGGFRLVTEPTRSSFQTINLLQLRDMGPHRVTVYRVNEEYADLYENRVQDSRDLNEPPSNVSGALGVFTAFNGSMSLEFDVVRGS